ncbi:MAG: tRNA dihydrouridine synthase DusB [Chlamydiota bacterium]
MKNIVKPFSIKNCVLDNKIFYAPLAGCSDYPFCKIAARSFERPGLLFCQMVKMDALVRHEPATYRLLDYDALMHPIGAQICGSKKEYVRDSCSILEDLGFDWIDLNCGCPVDKITKDGSGSALLKCPKKIGELIHEMTSSTHLPVSVKIRAGWDERSINAPIITKIAEEAGASVITIHGRTREQGYKGKAAYSPIREAKKVANTIKVFANGDIFDPESAEMMLEETSSDGILIARGTMGQPWIAGQILDYVRKGHYQSPDILTVKGVMLEHFEEIVSYQSDKKALLDMRRVGSWFLRYLSRFGNTSALKELIIKEKSPKTIIQRLQTFPWEAWAGSSPKSLVSI